MSNEVAHAPSHAVHKMDFSLAGTQYEMLKPVTRNVLQQVFELPFYVEFQGPFRKSDMNPEHSKYKDKKTGEVSLPEVADIINLETGECQILIGNAVLVSELTKKYPDNGYVGRLFGIKQTRDDADRRYKTYQIIEIRRKVASTGETVGVDKVAEIDATGAEAIDRAKRRK